MKEKKENLEKKPQTKVQMKLSRSRIIRIILFLVGLIAFVLGTIGIALPILPTVPFYLLASFCFIRSSERFSKWFLNSNLYKKHVENFATTRSMILKNELILLLCVSAMLITSMMVFDSKVLPIIMPILIICKYGYFVFRVKPISRPEFDAMQLERKLQKEAKKKAIEESKLEKEVTGEC